MGVVQVIIIILPVLQLILYLIANGFFKNTDSFCQMQINTCYAQEQLDNTAS